MLATMTLRQKAAQMVWPQILGDYVAADAPAWQRAMGAVTRDSVGGFIMSVGSPLEIAAKLNALQKMSALPLLVGADLEFGAGYRAKGGYFVPNGIDLGGAVVFPPQMALGATGDSTLAYEQGRVTAVEGRALGIHITFAPVLDVNNNPANPVINVRSYGADPRLVARLGAAFVRGVEEHGMLATGKHFPGHGDTGVNSHLALPVVNVSSARLDSVELVPFRAAVRAEVSAIMTFHGAMPALDPSGDPGTLSRPVLTGLLREEMKFDGLIFTDAMDMRGILVQYGPDTAAMRAVEAGADVLLMPTDVGRTIDAVVRGVSEGRYTEDRLDRSVRRILAAKERLRLHRQRTVDLDSARAIVGDSVHAALARTAAVRSITLVRDSLRLLPLGSRPASSRVLSITFARRVDLSAGRAFDAELRRVFRTVRAEFVDADANGADYERLLRAADSADVVIVSPYVGHAWDVATVAAPAAFADFVRSLVRRGRRPIVMAMGNPYFLQQVPDVSTYVVAWGGFPVSQQAAAWALLGVNAISGRLPIAIPPVAPFGAGMSRPELAAGASASTRSRQ
ncbi:MAG TPA: glycoside hydrolase family 3 N-terminal domain-containing protein [Gemmatimonadaceae bacterium]|nr:glycoside hydrolase family 3 N-terminal domain-containing protein [Gemmatimonadaceae bacterium]